MAFMVNVKNSCRSGELKYGGNKTGKVWRVKYLHEISITLRNVHVVLAHET